ncbi:MAG TPA: hypothetical protein VFA18_23630, partial [Gemmataceae bacterium]|nr:hypothetical protein [Gemmataceae bacterium]
MAKHCSSCNQSYTDDHHLCPHCGAAEPTGSTAPGSSPDIILGDATLGDGSDSNVVPVITDEGSASDSNVMPVSLDDSSLTNLNHVEGSSMDIDLGQGGGIDSSALIVGAADPGSPSDVIDVDWPAVAESSAEHRPLVPPPQKEGAAPTMIAPAAQPSSAAPGEVGDSSSALNLGRTPSVEAPQPSIPLDSDVG